MKECKKSSRLWHVNQLLYAFSNFLLLSFILLPRTLFRMLPVSWTKLLFCLVYCTCVYWWKIEAGENTQPLLEYPFTIISLKLGGLLHFQASPASSSCQSFHHWLLAADFMLIHGVLFVSCIVGTGFVFEFCVRSDNIGDHVTPRPVYGGGIWLLLSCDCLISFQHFLDLQWLPMTYVTLQFMQLSFSCFSQLGQ